MLSNFLKYIKGYFILFYETQKVQYYIGEKEKDLVPSIYFKNIYNDKFSIYIYKNFFPKKCLKFPDIVIIILLQTCSSYKIQSKPDLTWSSKYFKNLTQLINPHDTNSRHWVGLNWSSYSQSECTYQSFNVLIMFVEIEGETIYC